MSTTSYGTDAPLYPILVAIIREHGMRAEVRDGVVWGECSWSRREADGTFTTGETWERVGTSIRETRDWLGY